VELSKFEYKPPFGGNSSAPDRITIRFPLRLEDPFAGEKRRRTLEYFISATVARGGDLTPLIGECYDSPIAADTQKQVDVLLRPDTGLLSGIHDMPWSQAQKYGMSFKALVAPEVRMR